MGAGVGMGYRDQFGDYPARHHRRPVENPDHTCRFGYCAGKPLGLTANDTVSTVCGAGDYARPGGYHDVYAERDAPAFRVLSAKSGTDRTVRSFNPTNWSGLCVSRVRTAFDAPNAVGIVKLGQPAGRKINLGQPKRRDAFLRGLGRIRHYDRLGHARSLQSCI